MKKIYDSQALGQSGESIFHKVPARVGAYRYSVYAATIDEPTANFSVQVTVVGEEFVEVDLHTARGGVIKCRPGGFVQFFASDLNSEVNGYYVRCIDAGYEYDSRRLAKGDFFYIEALGVGAFDFRATVFEDGGTRPLAIPIVVIEGINDSAVIINVTNEVISPDAVNADVRQPLQVLVQCSASIEIWDESLERGVVLSN